MTSCQSAKVEDKETELPVISFPVFPNPKPFVTYDDETQIVNMPLVYWLSITEYVIEVRKVERIVNGE